ncbi:MAG TPA: 1-phosphofructokinase family hexose kinase [Bryobacteraceae bacterium]|nr:1-phosphofructokinase family hexose kinase [Bryobacteraceae bacterium]
MIVTLTLNPALDRTISVDHLAFEDRAYIQSSSESAGGRGLNSSRLIHSFGGETLALTVEGGETGAKLREHLRHERFKHRAVQIRKDIRTNLTITDARGLTVNLNERGPELSRGEVNNLERLVERTLENAKWLLLCGSIPPGVPSSFYAKLIAKARKRRVRTLLHASGDALREGVAARPTVVTPNQSEAERLVGRALLTRLQWIEAAAEIHSFGPESVVLSLASRGAVGAFARGLFEAVPPQIDAVCPIGSGDALTAAYAWRMHKGRTQPEDALRWGVAAGTASALLPGMNFANLEDTQKMYDRVELRRAE